MIAFFHPRQLILTTTDRVSRPSEVALSRGDSLQSGAEHISYNPLAVVGYF